MDRKAGIILMLSLAIAVLAIGALATRSPFDWPGGMTGAAGTRLDVMGIEVSEWEPGTLAVLVASCNARPDAEVTKLGDGRFEVEARATVDWDRGDDCGDGVSIPIDPELEAIEVTDLVSGTTFTWPTVPPPEPIDIDGTWEMVEVGGDPVEVGVNTTELPTIQIAAGFAQGNLGCNRGGVELLQDGDTMLPSPVGSEQELCSIPDGSEELVPTERTLLALFESGFAIERNGDRMTWTGDPGSVVFELVSE